MMEEISVFSQKKFNNNVNKFLKEIDNYVK